MAFVFDAYIVRVIDGDTAIVKPQVYRSDIYLRVRFKDSFKPEVDEFGGDDATAEAEALFPEGTRVRLTNDRIHWSYERLEARVDRV